MRLWILLCLAAALAAQQKDSVAAGRATTQTAEAPAASTQPKIDPAKAADIRRLIELTGATHALDQQTEAMTKSVRPLLVKSLPDGEYRERLADLFLERLRSKIDPQKMIDLIVPIYGRYFSAEDIKGLIQFYQTPVGQKAALVFPQVTAETTAAGQKWGESLGRDSMAEVLAEHPELARALQAAEKAAQPK
jgi:uncharacterized protein